MLSVFREITGVFGPSSLADLPPDVIWIDLLTPTTEEIAIVESQKHVRIPSIEALSEIESSSRLAVDHYVIYLSIPAVAQGDTPDAYLSPTGFILTKSALITVRFERLGAEPDKVSKSVFPTGQAFGRHGNQLWALHCRTRTSHGKPNEPFDLR